MDIVLFRSGKIQIDVKKNHIMLKTKSDHIPVNPYFYYR